jgi:type 1 glutamine amidotransferase/cytochrome c2
MIFRTLLLLCLGLSGLWANEKPKMVVLLAEDEYHTKKTLPHFFDQTCSKKFDIHYVMSDFDNRHALKGMKHIENADLLVLSVWRLALPKQHLNSIRDYMKTDKPVWVMRTSTHGFYLRPTQEVPEGSDQWPEFDKEILGCNYNGHASSAYMTDVTLGNRKSTLLENINPFSVRSWLYKVTPMSSDVNILLWGSARGSEKEPVAWTRTRKNGGKVFCTTLGHHEDFLSTEFQTLLYRSLYWCIDRDLPQEKLDYQFFNEYVEEKVSHRSLTFDARKSHHALHPQNLSSRALWLRAGEGYHIAFDLDLLRPAAIWSGEGVTNVGMAHGSYTLKSHSKKAKAGEKHLPEPVGDVLMSLPLVAGVDRGESLWHDPRKKIKNENQLSHGPLPEGDAQWKGMYATSLGPVLNYQIGPAKVFEKYLGMKQNGVSLLERKLKITHSKEALVFHLGQALYEEIQFKKDQISFKLENGKWLNLSLSDSNHAQFKKHAKGLDLVVKAAENIELSVFYAYHSEPLKKANFKASTKMTLKPMPSLWEKEVMVKSAREPMDDSAFVQEEIPLPYMNSGRRNIRSADIAFHQKGTAAIVTFDGDVWLLKELGSRKFIWKRFAAGLHEPQGIAIRDEEIFVFDRNGLIRLNDRDKNGEADFYENFSSLMIQSSETREFSMGLEVLSDGSFIIAKGGQRSHSLNPHAGALLKVAADGKSVKVIADGLREPYFGIDSKTDEIFASDQQGPWVPTTPFHNVKSGKNYGFMPSMIQDANKPYTKPNLFIPHPVLQSGAGILRVNSKKMGVFNNKLLYLGYSKPVVGLIDYQASQENHTSYYTLKEQFDFPLLKVAQNPQDGLVYFTGFRIWDSNAKRISGLSRLKPSKHFSMPISSQIYKEGIRVDFQETLQKESIQPIAFKLERWNYLRSHKYGSGYYNLSGEAGKENLLFSSLTLSHDKKSVFIAVPNMKESMSLGLSYTLVSEKGKVLKGDIYFSVKEMPEFEASPKEFAQIDFNALPIKLESKEPKSASAQFGKSVTERVGCIGCHSITNQREGRNGPPWKGLFASERVLKGGHSISANETYLKESILNPLAKVSEGYEATMPPYAGLLSEIELDSIILYLKSIK